MNLTTPEKCFRSFPSVTSVYAIVRIIFLLLCHGLLLLQVAHSKVITRESIKCSFLFTVDHRYLKENNLNNSGCLSPLTYQLVRKTCLYSEQRICFSIMQNKLANMKKGADIPHIQKLFKMKISSV